MITLAFSNHQSVKHLIESLGVPHVEVGRVTVNGEPAELRYRPRTGDRILVQPATGCPTEPRFLLDNHLGRLAAYLRMLGFDSQYDNKFSDEQMAEIVKSDARILLTRDRRLLMRKVVQFGYCPRSLEPLEQLQEVTCRFNLKVFIKPFHRCLRCNGILQPIEKDAVLDRLEPKTRLYYNEFTLCPDCGQIYWKGSHFDRMEKLVAHTI